MENYIVRIYRRDAGDPDKVVGIVERAETREKRHFHDLPALRRILSDPGTNGRDDGTLRRRLDRHADDGQGIGTKTG